MVPLQLELEDGVGAGGHVVALGRSYFSIGLGQINHILHIFVRLDLETGRLIVFIMSPFKVFFLYQVSDCLQIDLLVRAIEIELPPIVFVVFHSFKNFVNCPWNHPFLRLYINIPFHCMCFPRACLPIGKNTDFKAVESRPHKLLHLFEDFSLACVWSENCIKFKMSVLSVLSNACRFAARS